MEFEFKVRLVSGIENCFVSLPLVLIQTLQSSQLQRSSALLGEVLALELRSRSSDDLWAVAWSGATSTSPVIEIAQQFAECIALGEGTIVQVRVLGNVAKASLVTIEPDSEDDWEVLELNSELAEDAILKQVRIVHEAMRFPPWLHGRTIIKFRVMSTFPKNAVDLDAIAHMTEGFSGADLQALLSDAQLEAVHELLLLPRQDPLFQKLRSKDYMTFTASSWTQRGHLQHS